MKMIVDYTNEIPKWRLIKIYKDENGNEKIIKKYFKNLQGIADFLDESLQNVGKFTCNANGYKTKMKYQPTIKRWKGIQIDKMKVKKVITYELIED